ncbi:MAG: peptidyl-tRNA hydrolase Pth2 [Candidatus Bilamarchaeaceae archaeon]
MYKQVIVVRSDLEMGKGKIAAQSSHASLISYEKVKKTNPEVAEEWIREGQKKVVLKVKGEEELLRYFDIAKKNGIPCELVRDAGHTQIEPGTITCFAAGPWDEKKLDEIFGELKLL